MGSPKCEDQESKAARDLICNRPAIYLVAPHNFHGRTRHWNSQRAAARDRHSVARGAGRRFQTPSTFFKPQPRNARLDLYRQLPDSVPTGKIASESRKAACSFVMVEGFGRIANCLRKALIGASLGRRFCRKKSLRSNRSQPSLGPKLHPQHDAEKSAGSSQAWPQRTVSHHHPCGCPVRYQSATGRSEGSPRCGDPAGFGLQTHQR